MGKPYLRAWAMGLIMVGLTLLAGVMVHGAVPPQGLGSSAGLTLAQGFKVSEASQRFYQASPNFPRENHYRSARTGEVAADSTLVDRLIRYHFYVKGRPLQYRFDWKLTLGDYLGLNELMQPDAYPGRDTLKDNPLEGDRQVLQKLNRAQREALILDLVSLFNPAYAQLGTSQVPPPTPPDPWPSSPTTAPPPRTGADLLR